MSKQKIIYFLLLIILGSIIFYLFKIEIENERLEDKDVNIGEVSEDMTIPYPDRIIYKNQENKYIILSSKTKEYATIYSELFRRVSNIVNGQVYSEEEITNMQERGSFIEFDYNTKSKNFVFMLDEDGIGIIRRFTDSGQVIKRSIEDREDLIKKMNEITKDEKKYNFDRQYNYTSKNKIAELPEDLDFNQVRVGVYQEIIKDEYKNYKEILEKLNFEADTKNVNFDKETVIITVSKYEIKNITQNIGNIKYEFGEFLDEYTVNLLVVSKVVNTDCIYYNVKDLDENSSVKNETVKNTDEFAVEYVVEDSKYYALADEKTEIISLEKACDIADLEAKDEKYQYQGWKSEFYTRGKNKDDYISAELISNLSEISRLYYWEEKWQKRDFNSDTLMWRIRLFDENDPLTSLYIYVDAVNGDVIGAGDLSD